MQQILLMRLHHFLGRGGDFIHQLIPFIFLVVKRSKLLSYCEIAAGVLLRDILVPIGYLRDI